MTLVGFLTDLLWFKELGYLSVFLKKLFTELQFGIPAFIVITLVCFFYLQTIKKAYYKKIGAYDTSKPEKKVNTSLWAISLAFGTLTAYSIADRLWFELLQYISSTDFNILDPIFNKDVSFYIFRLEFLQEINSLLLWIVIGFVAVNVIFYISLLNLRKPQFFDEVEAGWESGSAKTNSRAGYGGIFAEMFGMGGGNNPFSEQQQAGPIPPRPSYFSRSTMSRLLGIAGLQFKVLGVIFFLMLGLHYLLKQFTLLYTSSSGVVYGAGFADINVTLWVYRLMIVLAVAAAVMFVIGLNQRRWRTVLAAPAVMIVLLILGSIATAAVQSLVVAPDEINKEYTFLENNIAFTRYAYDLQDINIEEYNVTYNLTIEDILNNAETITNIRINDYEPALKYYNQTQSIRLYYTFSDVDVDRYMVNGEYTQTFLSAREIDEGAITDQWLTRHIKYTHGYGITLSRVDKVTESGQPDMLIDSIPPVSDVEEIDITQPEIYFGELTEDYIIVNTDEEEFDYPSGESNVYTKYEGDAGIKLTFFTRLLFALREGDIQLLVSTNIDKDSRVIIYRNVEERVKTIAPFLEYDDDPYIVTADGGLYWIFDAYTTSGYYPYSEPYSNNGINYIRNSVKVVVDAYNGDASFYIVDPDDPIAMTLQKIYPALFKDFEEMPESLQTHIRYPNTMFTIQANVYTKYHMTDVNVFYQNEDGWNIATEIYGTEQVTMSPNYYIMKLPGESKAEFINSIPYTPSGKFNLTALLVARNDGECYGDLVLYQMPKDRIIYGPQQVEAQINQNTEIAQDFTLWSSAGATYARGNMFVIPIEGSLMYVEPIYLESANSSLPEVKRVIIYYNERIAYEETLAEALDSMFGAGASAVATGSDTPDVVTPDDENTTDSVEDLAQKANEAFQNALNAQQDGDWAAYGRYLDELEGYLQQMVPEAEEDLTVDMDLNAEGTTSEQGEALVTTE